MQAEQQLAAAERCRASSEGPQATGTACFTGRNFAWPQPQSSLGMAEAPSGFFAHRMMGKAYSRLTIHGLKPKGLPLEHGPILPACHLDKESLARVRLVSVRGGPGALAHVLLCSDLAGA